MSGDWHSYPYISAYLSLQKFQKQVLFSANEGTLFLIPAKYNPSMAEAQGSLDRVSSATIESLRARLLAERASSKEARLQAQEIAAKVSKLQARLDAEAENRIKAQMAMVEILDALKAKGIPMERVMASSSILASESLDFLNHLKWSRSEELSPNSVKKDGRDGTGSPHSSQESGAHAQDGQEQVQEQLHRSSSEQTDSDPQSRLCEETASSSSKEGSSAEKTLPNHHSEGANLHTNGLDVSNEHPTDHCITGEGLSLGDGRYEDDRGHTPTVEPEAKAEDAMVMGEVVKQPPSLGSVGELSANRGDLVDSDASSSGFGDGKAMPDGRHSNDIGYGENVSSSEIGYGRDGLARQVPCSSGYSPMKTAQQQTPIPSVVDEALTDCGVNGKLPPSGGSASRFADGRRDGLAGQGLYPDDGGAPRMYGDSNDLNSSYYQRKYAYSGKISAYKNSLAGYMPPSVGAYPGFISPNDGWPLRGSTRELNDLQMHIAAQMHNLSTQAPFGSAHYHLGRHGYAPGTATTYQNAAAPMPNQTPRAATASESVLSLVDEKNGKLGNVLSALSFAKQQLSRGSSSTGAGVPSLGNDGIYEHAASTSGNGKAYGAYYRDGSYQQKVHYWNQAPVQNQASISSLSRGSNGHRFDPHNGLRSSSSDNAMMMANDLPPYHLQPRGEVHLGNGITLYTD